MYLKTILSAPKLTNDDIEKIVTFLNTQEAWGGEWKGYNQRVLWQGMMFAKPGIAAYTESEVKNCYKKDPILSIIAPDKVSFPVGGPKFVTITFEKAETLNRLLVLANKELKPAENNSNLDCDTAKC